MTDLLSLPPGEVLRRKRALLRELGEAGPFTPVRIALLGGSTIGEIEPLLRLFLLAYGIDPVFFIGQYDRWYEEVVFEDPALVTFKPDIVWIHVTFRNAGDPEALGDKLVAAWDTLGSPVILQNNIELPPYRVMGNRDASHGLLGRIEALNRRIAEAAVARSKFYINDIHWLSAQIGLDVWYDDALWYTAKYACSLEALPLLCGNTARIVKSLLGKNQKALALDLDNTLWGGVVGDDGAEGLEQTSDTPRGMAFSEFQSYIKAVSALGIPLAIVSKNDPDTALTGFSKALLKPEDFSAVYANWRNKDENLRAAASDLNLGTDSLVFIDDNPAERALVRASFPDTAIPELSGPETYIRALDRAGYFEVTAQTPDDTLRVASYKAERERRSGAFADYGEFLRSLKMKATFGPVNRSNQARVTQLINKTNQFNLTTRRLPEAEVEALSEDPGTVTLCGSLSDTFGDSGLVTVLFASVDGPTACIELWVMSCRVFKRGLEFAALRRLLEILRERGTATVRGRFLPTAKNGPVKDLYRELGFTSLDGEVWEAPIDSVRIPETFMEVRR